MLRTKCFLVLLTLAAQLPLASATITYAVGTCEPKITSFTTITKALQATKRPNVIKVCPGAYTEQVVITFPVALEGISASNSAGVVIVPPSGGLVANASDEFGDSIAAQVLVENVGGEVNLSNLIVNAGGGQTGSSFIVGVFYQNSSGTISHVETENQSGNGFGIGVWLGGGSNSPTVTLESNNLQRFDYAGVVVKSYNPALTVHITGNNLKSGYPNGDGIYLVDGGTSTVSGNTITSTAEGVLVSGGTGSVSKNTIVAAGIGIDLESDGVSAISNTIFDGVGYEIGILANSAAAPVTGNTIAQSNYAIIFNCKADTNVHSNTILNAAYGLYSVPTGVVSPNTYFNVGTNIVGGC